ncbi:MAG TPA: tripartite tricarboxylate transporter TctB family protein [Xanthomonadaceae bacterium]|nr:tripartite tricarboxylate transporter TctB family protein [Xanthomonadaceae bacterium]
MKIDRINLISGAMFAAFGVLALVLASDLPTGRAANMGAGYFPRVLSFLLIGFGVLVAFTTRPPGGDEELHIAWRPLISLTLATVLFAVLLPLLGVLLTLLVMCAVSRVARPEYSWRETAVLSVCIALLCALIFHYGLGVQMPMWPALG